MSEKYRLITTAEEVDEMISDEALESAIDWFEDEPSMPTDEYLDRLLGGYLVDEQGRELDLDNLDNPAARRIMSRARKLRRERES